MGCDYYVITTLHITTKDGKKHEVEYEKIPRYTWTWHEDDDESYEERLERTMNEEHDEKVIFAKGEWLIKNKDLIAAYTQAIEKCIYFQFDFQDVTDITREKDAEERC